MNTATDDDEAAYIYSLDVIEWIRELREEPPPAKTSPVFPLWEAGREKLKSLEGLARECESTVAGWEQGVLLIKDSYFTQYAIELTAEREAYNPNAERRLNHVDGTAAAHELQRGFMPVRFAGSIFWAPRKAQTNMSATATSNYDDVIAAYKNLLATLFPRWQAGLTWQVKVGQRAHYHCNDGYCDPDNRVIGIAEHIARDEQQLRLTLVHEMVHAIKGPGHGKPFCRRLGVAARMAARQGDPKLARDLRDESVLYATTLVVRAAQVYGLMRDWAPEAPSFEAAEVGVARECGLTVEELRQRYPKLRAIWDGARKKQVLLAVEGGQGV
jgi:hypothetical protein